MNIGIVDYGMGNLRSVSNAVRLLGHSPVISSSPEVLRNSDKLILPGVGAFGDAIEKINSMELDIFLKQFVKNEGKWLLGICLGMQLLCTESFEFGQHKGLGFIPGSVIPFEKKLGFPVPHMGWNSLKIIKASPVFDNVKVLDFYFVHSYHLDNKVTESVIATSDYVYDFPAIIMKDNVVGMQFHPEKSQNSGLSLLKNFLSF